MYQAATLTIRLTALVLLFAMSQAYISRARVDSFSLTADMMYVAANAPRIARALFEIAARNRWAGAADMLLKLCKVRSDHAEKSPYIPAFFAPDLIQYGPVQ
jgi:hypothetical protein